MQRHGFNANLGVFVQSYGSTALDASLLLLPLLGVIKATDPRMRSTIEQIGQHLMRDGLVYRSGTKIECLGVREPLPCAPSG